MTYQVVWLPSALDELTSIWLAASDRASVTAASQRIDERLAASPLLQGESRDSDSERIVFDPPLQVLARVSQGEHTVWVAAVALVKRPSA
jgi:plasmid stabilization system protein ParE